VNPLISLLLTQSDGVRALLVSNPLRLILVNNSVVPKWHTQGVQFARALTLGTPASSGQLHDGWAD
jgi:hypothetical protein